MDLNCGDDAVNREMRGETCQGQVQVASHSFPLSHVNPVLTGTMNGFSDHGLDEGAFGESKATSVVKAFDAFRTRHSSPSPS